MKAGRWAFLGLPLLLLLGLSITGCSSKSSTQERAPLLPTPRVPTTDILHTAMKAGNFKTLVKAFQDAGLTNVLEGDKDYTLFAPTDRAFENLPDNELHDLLMAQNKDKLKNVLMGLLVQGEALTVDLKKVKSLKAANGQELAVSVEQDKIVVGGATIVNADMICSNGLIQGIDTVIMPK